MNLVEIKMTNNDKVPELTNGEFEDFTKKGIVIVDFFAEWCMPCLIMSPIIDELSEKLKEKVKFGKINVDDNQELARKFNISSIPCMIVFKNGQPVERFIGTMSQEDIENKLKKLI